MDIHEGKDHIKRFLNLKCIKTTDLCYGRVWHVWDILAFLSPDIYLLFSKLIKRISGFHQYS